jgi:hypothetical protein
MRSLIVWSAWCGGVSIVPDEKGAGVTIVHDHHAAELAWKRRGKWRGKQHGKSVMHGRIIGFMAGREAEIIKFGDKHEIGDGDDRRQIMLMAEEADASEAYLERLRTKVGPLLRRHWRKLEAVAEVLLVRKTLFGSEIDAIVKKKMTRRERDIAKRIERRASQ